MELDARDAVISGTVEVDLCIVGAGPVGLVLADALRSAGLRLAIVESGSVARDTGAQELNAGEVVGDAYHELRTSRWRGVGGTAGIWNTMVRGAIGAKYLPLDAVDFKTRKWAPLSGWPFDCAELDRYYSAAHRVCGLGPFDYRAETWCDARRTLLDLGGGGVTNAVYQCGPAEPFVAGIWSRLRVSGNVTAIHGGSVTGLIRDRRGGPITAVRWVAFTGGAGTVRASRFVLAAGALENARILLLDLRAAGRRSTSSDWIGRCFMEHPVDASLELVSRVPALAGDSFYLPHGVEGAPAVMGRIALSPELLRELEAPNASVRVLEADEPVPLPHAARATARRLVPWPAARRAIGELIRRAAGLGARFRGARYRLLIDLEQWPHCDNRVALSTATDRFGQPRAELHWRWRPEDEARRERVRAAIGRELQRAGVGRIIVTPHRPLDPNAHHHAGTTRMHADPAQGVVDAMLRVHGEENLYVAGASVFPTAGFANPTLTALALALRLADHLADRA